jgi:type I restriction-modification system DNA methylase subunit
MEKQQARSLVHETFTRPFKEESFHAFVQQLLNHLDDSPERQSTWAGARVKRAYSEHINHFKRLGTYTDPEGRKVDLLVIHLKAGKGATLERGRTLLRNFAAAYLATGHGSDKDAVLAAYVSPRGDDWRFSFVKLEYVLEQTEQGRVREQKELTPARRHSFLVGTNEKSHTAQKQFLPLLENDQSDPLLSEIEDAFKIEKVTKEFFERYKGLFDKTKRELEGLVSRDSAVRKEFEEHSIETADFAKKLLGQIVFLYFLQKKGWFGVKRNEPWGSGDKDYLRYLFNERSHLGPHHHASGERPVNFFNDILEHLFYEALATERTNHYFGRFDCRIPFLNGGLFEPLLGYNWDSIDVLLPDELFSNKERTKEGDEGTGILDVFDRYNFTVNEAEPLETEIAVDPEMLGKVFESLLPENEKHGKGTYYTPRVVVHYMCQQSLINYLSTNLEGKVARPDIEYLIHHGEVVRQFEANQRKAEKNTLPEAIRRHAGQVDRLLADIAVCDPAIGSGAFPVGMMQEIVKARWALASIKGMPAITPYELKRHAIESSLYGVDIDPGAIEIARLRLWLSLVVDEDDITQIQPLPNLDYKIMQGNSLLEEFEGVTLIEDNLIAQFLRNREAQIAELKARFNRIQREIVVTGSKEGRRSPGVLRLENEMKRAEKQSEALHLDDDKPQPQMVFEEIDNRIAENLQEIERLRRRYLDSYSTSEKKRLRAQIDEKEWEIMEGVLRQQDKKEALRALAKHRRDNKKNYFLWKFYFSQVFRAKGGFDVVIANPPYVRHEEIKYLKAALQRTFSVYTGTSDLYVYFFEQGLRLLDENGGLAFITSNSFLNSGFGEKLRALLGDKFHLNEIIDFGEARVFEATTEPCILILTNNHKTDEEVLCLKWDETEPVDSLGSSVMRRSFRLPQKDLTSEGWRIESPMVLGLLQQLRQRGMPLGEYVDGRFYYGVKTGLNEAFVVDRATRDALIAEDQSSAELLKPFLRGRDIRRWVAEFQDIWLIFTRRGINIQKYPAIYRHLLKFKDDLMPGAPGGRKPGSYKWYEIQDNVAYWKEFQSPKIVYQDIARFFGMAWDDTGAYLGNTCYFIPNAEKWMLGILLSSAMKFYVQKTLGSGEGGFIRLFSIHVRKFPIPSLTAEQKHLLSRLVDYILFLKEFLSAETRSGQLIISYFEQLVDAVVYELYLTDEMHEAGKQFFGPLAAEGLPALDDMQGDKLAGLRHIFERLFDRDHIIRQNIFFLDTIESVRIIEGKA